ncbi:MAG: citrate lyase acyl carrier protein [Spirochaetes bacterium]|nr:citrate lyase acyl carrier protein [Spirochaetota bacterium]
MKILKKSISGTLESSDVLITVEENLTGGNIINLESDVEKQFGKQIRQVIEQALSDFKVTNALVTVIDKGGLNCTIRARIETALMRATQTKTYTWGEKNEIA